MGDRRIKVAILGSGNIGTDLMYKVKRSSVSDLEIVAGIDPKSDDLSLARRLFHVSGRHKWNSGKSRDQDCF